MTDMDHENMQLIKDVSEIKGLLHASLTAHSTRLSAVEADINDSRRVHTDHDTALAAHAARIAVVENTSASNRDKLEKAGDQSRANAALIVSVIVGLAGVFTFGLNLLTQIGVVAS